MALGKLGAAAALSALALTGCNRGPAVGGASGVCKPFSTPKTPEAGAPVDPTSALDDCLHRWGYTLAASPDKADVTAQATLDACASQLAAWNQQSLTSAAGGAPNGGAVQAPSLMTGEQTNPLAEHYRFAQGRALFYVVEARAGKCGPPPAEPASPTPARS